MNRVQTYQDVQNQYSGWSGLTALTHSAATATCLFTGYDDALFTHIKLVPIKGFFQVYGLGFRAGRHASAPVPFTHSDDVVWEPRKPQ